MRGRDEHRTLSLCGVSTFLNKLSLAQHAYFKQEISLKKDIQRHSKENIHLKSCCNWKMFFMHKRLVLDVD